MKPILIEILQKLGLENENDMENIISVYAFFELDEDLILKAVKEYDIHYPLICPLDTETKFEIVNRILELKHGLIIDSVKDIDGIEYDGYRYEGYKMELLPSGC